MLKTLVLFIAVALFASVATAWASAVRSASLRRKFEALGVIPGRTMDEILRHVGKPNQRYKLHTGREILEWRRITFRVALGFTAGVCDTVEHDTGQD